MDALDRMHVDHEIVFACDNGDVELEMPKVKVDIDAIETELKVLKKKVKAFNLDFADEESVDYAAQLDVMLVGVEGELKKLLERLEVSDDELKVINEALGDVDRILKSSMDATTASKKKKYKELLEIRNDSASDKAKLFFLLRVTLTLINDEIEYDSEPLKIIAKRYEQSIKKIIKSGKDLSERLDMIYDKLFYLDANIELKQLDSYEARKKYVDSSESNSFNLLAVLLFLLQDYFENGVYTNTEDIIECNGSGEILWDKTINETFTLLSENRPYYIELQTRKRVTNDFDYFKRLHECLVTMA